MLKMESWQKQVINKNLVSLIENTSCSIKLLATLKAFDVIGRDDEEAIVAKPTSMGQSSLLYDTLLTRKGAYLAISKALFCCKQSGAYNILHEEVFRHGIPEMRIQYSATVTTIENAFGMDAVKKIKSSLKNILEEEEFLEICMNAQSDDTPLCLVNTEIPPLPPYYIPRSLSNRVKIRPEAFKQTCTDIFVFKGIERTRLSGLASPKYTTAMSTTQLLKISAQFILLENNDDWDDICAKATEPIHLIKCEMTSANQASYILEGTMGQSEIIHNFVEKKAADDLSTYISEETFVKEMHELKNISCVFVCDTAGMGKSLLLASIARLMEKEYPDRVRAFISLSKFIQKVPRPFPEISGQMDTRPFGYILKSIAPSPLALKLLQILTDTTQVKTDLFLDGFDEILPAAVEWTKLFLQALISGTRNLRIYITSRPHYKIQLEKTFGLISYDILPFKRQNQLEFLIRFWQEDLRFYEAERLQIFGSLCLKKLFKSTKKEERDILGIPLLCYLFADVHLKQARVFCKPGKKVAETTIFDMPSSATEMYRQFIEMRLTKFADGQNSAAEKEVPVADMRMIKEFHVWKALEEIFPWLGREYSLNKQLEQVSKHILSAGILQTSAKPNSSKAEFQHRTVAEFLVAEYVAETLLTEDSSAFQPLELNCSVIKCLAQDILKTSQIGRSKYHYLHVQHSVENEYPFTQEVITYFLNDMIRIAKSNCTDQYIADAFVSALTPENLYRIFESAIYNKFGHLFCLFKNMLTLIDDSVLNKYKLFFLKRSAFLENGGTVARSARELNDDDEFTQPLYWILCTIAEYGTLNMMEDLEELSGQYFQLNLDQMCQLANLTIQTPLERAVRRGKYEMVERLSGKFPLKQRSLLYYCIRHSYGEPVDIVDTRLEICKLLLAKEPTVINEPDHSLPDTCTGPLATDCVHLKLLMFLIESGSDLRAVRSTSYGYGSRGNNIVHCAAEYLSSPDLYEFCEFLIQGKQATYLFLGHPTPLHCILQKPNLATEQLTQMILNVSGFNITNYTRNSSKCNLLHSAVHGNADPSILEILIAHGVDYKFNEYSQNTLLHLAVIKGNMKLVKYFMSKGLSVTERRHGPNTVILSAYNHLEILKYLLSEGADVSVRDSRSGDTVVHKAGWHMSDDDFSELIVYLFTNAADQFKSPENYFIRALYYRLKDQRYKVDLRTLKLFLEIPGAKHGGGNFSDTLLHAAVSGRQESAIVKELCRNGSNVRFCNRRGLSAADLAAETDNLEMYKCILSLGFDFSRDEYSQLPPLLMANDSVEIIKYLIQNGADVNATDAAGNNIAHAVAFSGRIMNKQLHQFVLLLLNHDDGAKVLGAENNKGETLLRIRLREPYHSHHIDAETIEIILKNVTIDINGVDGNGHNDFLVAAAADRPVEVLKALVNNRAQYNITNHRRQNALHLTLDMKGRTFYENGTRRTIEKVTYLLSLGIDAKQKDMDGNLPLDHAMATLDLAIKGLRKNEQVPYWQTYNEMQSVEEIVELMEKFTYTDDGAVKNKN